MAAGADIDHKDTWGWTPLMYESKYLTSIPHLLRLVRFQTFPWCLCQISSTATSSQKEIYNKIIENYKKIFCSQLGGKSRPDRRSYGACPGIFKQEFFEKKKKTKFLRFFQIKENLFSPLVFLKQRLQQNTSSSSQPLISKQKCNKIHGSS